MAERLNNHDVVIGPPLRDLASVRHFYNGKAENWESKSNNTPKLIFINLDLS